MATEISAAPAVMPQLQSVQKAMALPTVGAAVGQVGAFYTRVKGAHSLLEWALSTAEASVTFAATTAAPYMAAPLAAGDAKMAAVIDEIERRVPLVTEQPKVIVETTKQAVLSRISPHVNKEQDDPDRTISLPPTPPVQRCSREIFTEVVEEDSPVIDIGQYVAWNQPGPSWQSTPVVQLSPPLPSPPSLPLPSPPLPPPPSPTQSPMGPRAEVPAPQGHTPTRTRRGRATRRVLGSPRQRVRPQTNVEQATEHFLHSDEEWRKLLLKRMEDEAELERERVSLRKMELENEKRWQEIAASAVNVLNKISNSKLCKD